MSDLSSSTASSRQLSGLRRRRGVAAVEFAVLLPVIALLVFGSIEAASFIFLKQALQVAAYEGIREAVRSTGTEADATDRAGSILKARQVRDATVRFPEGDLAAAKRGDRVVIEITAPTSTNSPLAGLWINNQTLSARLLMLKE
jgi:Flp pilus assembly protein TadG